MNDKELLQYERIAIDIALEAGAMITRASVASKVITKKDSSIDLVTESDKQVERYVADQIKQHFPKHLFIGEESRYGSTGRSSSGRLPSEPTWIVDPIDGTMNFVHTFPYTCVCIALAIGGQPVVGVVYAPLQDKLYTSRKGSGARCNGRPIRVSTACSRLSKALVISELGSHQDLDNRRKILINIEAVGWRAHGFRCMACAALQLCAVAEGSADAYWHYGLHVWDMAAAGLVLLEAGGVLLDTTGQPINLMARRVLGACSDKIGSELSAALTNHSDFEHD